MALIGLESFNHQADADKATKWTTVGASTGSGTTKSGFEIAAVGPRSNNALRILTSQNANSNSGWFSWVPDSPIPSGATFGVGLLLRVVNTFSAFMPGTNSEALTATGLGTNVCSALLACRYLGTTQFWLRFETNGKLSVMRGTATLGTSSSALTQNVYQYIELVVVINGSTGTVNLKFDGVSVLSLSSQNTQNGSAAAWDEFRLGSLTRDGGASAGAQYDVQLADMYLLDASGSDGWTTFMNAIRVDPRFMTANGTNRDWSPSTGTDDYAVIDENPANGDTDYLTATAAGNKVDCVTQDSPVVGANILGVQVVAQIRKTDGGAAGHKALVRIGGVDYLGTEVGVPSSYAFLRQCWGKSPATGVAWTESEFNGAKFGADKST